MTLTTAKRLMALFLCTTLLFSGLFAWQLTSTGVPSYAAPSETEGGQQEGASPNLVEQPEGNYTDGMKIPTRTVLDQEVKEREGDLGIGIHAPYKTSRSGYYNMTSFGKSLAFHLAIGYPF